MEQDKRVTDYLDPSLKEKIAEAFRNPDPNGQLLYRSYEDEIGNAKKADRFFKVLSRATELWSNEVKKNPNSQKSKDTLWAIIQACEEMS